MDLGFRYRGVVASDLSSSVMGLSLRSRGIIAFNLGYNLVDLNI
jgi:hypothetical protein